LDALSECDKITGTEPYSGAYATIEQIAPFVDYIANYVEKKLEFIEQILAGKIHKIEETSKKQQNVRVNVRVNSNKNVRVKDNIVNIIKQKSNVTVSEMANLLSVEERTIYRNMEKLKTAGIIERIGSDKSGYWAVRR
jgi:predicted HTH transcriptional regulator